MIETIRLIVFDLINLYFELFEGDPEHDVPGHETGETRNEALVEGTDTLVGEHTSSSIDSTSVLARRAVHVASFHDVDWCCCDGREQSGQSSCGEMAHDSVHQQSIIDYGLLDDVVAHNLGYVNYGIS